VIADSGYVGDINALPTNSRFDDAQIVGDINGDGYADVVSHVLYQGPAGPLTYYSGGITPVARYAIVVYYGSANGLIRTDASGNGPSYLPSSPGAPQLITDTAFNSAAFETTAFGQIFCSAGDTNGDGYVDLFVSALTTGNYVFYGSAAGIVAYGSSGGQVVGTPPLASTGSALDPKIISAGTYAAPYSQYVVTRGDFNGDGYSDVAMTYYGVGNAPVYVIYGSVNGLVSGGKIMGPEVGAAYATEPNPYNKAVRTPNCTIIGGNTFCQPF
jgi:hypothetical protein